VSREALTTYLKDHLAGSVAAVELLDFLIGLHGGSSREEVLTKLRIEVEEDQNVLRRLLNQAGGSESTVRRAAAWLTEKLGQIKLKVDDPGSGQLQVLEGLETLELGIQGKLALWRALGAAADGIPQIRDLDLTTLERRARDQIDRVQGLRLEVARLALFS
jgi:hypothetical protein